jgi:hypothetical protein
MTCECVQDGTAGSWRCSGCPPALPTDSACYGAGSPAEGCDYGNTNCTCSASNDLRCTGGCLLEWFSMVETSTNTPVPFTEEERIDLVGRINAALHPFVFRIWVERDVHGHDLAFLSNTQWIVNSGLGSAELTPYPPDGHSWIIECMP